MIVYKRAAGLPYPQVQLPLGADIFAVESQIHSKASARFDDELRVRVRIERIGRTSSRFRIATF